MNSGDFLVCYKRLYFSFAIASRSRRPLQLNLLDSTYRLIQFLNSIAARPTNQSGNLLSFFDPQLPGLQHRYRGGTAEVGGDP